MDALLLNTVGMKGLIGGIFVSCEVRRHTSLRKPTRGSVALEAASEALTEQGTALGKADVHGRVALTALVANDLACVKTRTSAKCRKNNSPSRHRT
jgi:hypothetical protein